MTTRTGNRRRGAVLVTMLVLASSGFLASNAMAQDRFDLVSYRPAPSQRAGGLETMGGTLLAPAELDVALSIDFARSPFTIETDDGLTEGKIVTSLTTTHLLAAVGIIDRLELGIDLPVVAAQRGDSIPGFRTQPLASSTTTIGDVRVVPRGMLWSRERAGGLSMHLSLAADVSLPTGDPDAYSGDGAVRVEPGVGFDLSWARGHRLLVDVAYRARRSVDFGPVAVDDALVGRAAGEFSFVPGWFALAEVATATVFNADLGAEDAPVEGRLGVGGRLHEFYVAAHLGTGLTTGAGAADWRVGATLGWADQLGRRGPDVRYAAAPTSAPGPGRGPGDSDGDGIPNNIDQCPDEPEDYDAYDDDDGCPDIDFDGDGIIDVADRCPEAAETFNGVEDDDGCPEMYAVNDRDNDLVPDEHDLCPLDPEDLDGLVDQDGCPETDADGDGVLDERDGCPLVAGTARGCPTDAAFFASRSLQVTFPQGQFTLDRFSREVVRDTAAALASNSGAYRVRVRAYMDEGLDRVVARAMAQRRLQEISDLLIGSGVRADSIVLETVDERSPGALAIIDVEVR